jgi:dTDP-4-dehydrorhamnose reductase
VTQDTRHLIVGRDGLIGRAIFDLLEHTAEVHGTTRRPAAGAAAFVLDLAAPECSVERVPGLAQFFDGRPLVVYITAGISGYDQCEADPAATRQVNVVNLVRIAHELLRHGAFVVFPSSTAVFSGSRSSAAERDAPDPVSEYGRQKAETEAQLRALSAGAATGGGVAIVRLTKVVARGSGRISAWIDRLSAGLSVEAARDLRFAPISLAYTAKNLVEIGKFAKAGPIICRAQATWPIWSLLACWQNDWELHQAWSRLRTGRAGTLFRKSWSWT